MKNLLNISATFLVALFLFSFGVKSEAQSQPCPPYYHHVIDTISISGCDYEIDLCVLCAAAYPGEIKVNSVTQLDTNCYSTLDPNEQLQYVFTQIGNAPTFWNDYCNDLPPCGMGTERIKIYYPYCWKLKRLDTPPNEPRYEFLRCSDESCIVTYDYCIDSNGDTQKTLVSSSSTIIPPAEIPCEIEGEDLEYQHLLPYEESECFILHTPCNPDFYPWP